MSRLSTLRGPVLTGLRSAVTWVSRPNVAVQNALHVRNMAGRVMQKTPSRYRYNEMKDKFHYFYLLTAIPMALIITYIKIRIGPAVLKEIPEGYVPEEYEYYKDPISRWMARVWPLYDSYVKSYERTLYYIHVELQRKKTEEMMCRARELNLRREDVKGWYFVPYDTSIKDDAFADAKQFES